MNNDPTTWTYPVIAAIAGPGMRITGIRELTVDEVSKVKEYAKVCSAARNRFKLFAILQKNYSQWREYIQSLLKPGDDLDDDQMVELDRLQLNFLSSAKSLLDHFRQEWTQKHRKTPKEKEFNIFIQRLEKVSWAFAFFQDLRNFTQHCGLPVGNYSRSFSASSVTLTVACDSEWLVEHFSGWGKSKLTRANGKLDLISLTRDYFVQLQQNFGNFVATEFAPGLLETHNFFAGMAKEVADVNPRATFHLLTGYTRNGDQISFQISTPPSDLLGSLGITVSPKDPITTPTLLSALVPASGESGA